LLFVPFANFYFKAGNFKTNLVNHKFKTKREREMMQHEGHLYYINKSATNGKGQVITYWRCRYQRKEEGGCKATLRTGGDLEALTKHTHTCTQGTSTLQHYMLKNKIVEMASAKETPQAPTLAWNEARKYAAIKAKECFTIGKAKQASVKKHFLAVCNR
jgi:hypothetical protein